MAEARPIIPATTSIAAVLGVFPNGPVDQAVPVASFAEFMRVFGDPIPLGSSPSMAAYAIWQLFLNGGPAAWVVRLGDESTAWDEAALLAAVTAQLADDSPLDRIEPQHFDLMCIPDLAFLSNAAQQQAIAAACAFCAERRAFLIADPPPPAVALAGAWLPGAGANAAPIDGAGTSAGMSALRAWADPILDARNEFGAAYYPWVQISDPWNGGATTRLVPPSGSVAGVYAANDAARGVWRAPAGIDAVLQDVAALADDTLTDRVQGELNPLGLNCLRDFPTYGKVVWGARTLAGADTLAAEFKYVPVRRLANYVERTLRQSMAWVALEQNGAPLWQSIALQANQFMAGLFAAGALEGTTPAEAFHVTCDASPADVLAGVVNLRVQLAVAEPAEFVPLTIVLNAAPPDAG